MTIKIIAATDLNLGLGFENELLCKLPNDMKRFKQLTTGDGTNTVLCGSNTYDSMGNLPNRHMVIATRDKNKYQDIHTTDDVENFVRLWKEYSLDKDLWIIGGQQIYEQTIKHADEVYMTTIINEFELVDSYFPELGEEWEVQDVDKFYKDDNHKYNHTFWKCTRKTR